MSASIELRPMGDRAVLACGMTDPTAWSLAVKKGSDPFLSAAVTVPAAATVLVVCSSPAALAELMPCITAIDPAIALPPAAGEAVEISVVYDGVDLDDVAAACGMTVADVIRLHSGAEYTVAFCGFSPGFAYLRGLPAELRLPRRPTPRPSVAVGSVAVASEFTAVYPRCSPGGWNLLGTTSVTMFDGSADGKDGTGPALLTPGDRVRFIPVDQLPPSATVLPNPAIRERVDEPAFTVVSAGVASTIQDAGRLDGREFGVPPSGMVDPMLGALMNRLLGNSPTTALIETCGAIVIRADRALVVTSTELISPVYLAIGQTFSVRGGGGRLWHYLAVRGGVVAVGEWGSSSTDTLSGLGPGALVAGDSFGVGVDPATPLADASPVPAVGSIVRISPGPRLDWFADDTFQLLSRSTLNVVQASRIGVRLDGPQLARVRHDELPSEGLVRGAIQAPPSGELVMMLADHPTTGGYPVVAVVHHDDVHKVAQLPMVTCTPA